MTTIKINQDLEIKGCDSCPFAEALEETDCGEFTGVHCYCGLLGLGSNKDVQGDYDAIGYEYFREDKPDTCPIIETSIE